MSDLRASPLYFSAWRAPLALLALAVTAGIVLDRLAPVPLAVSMLLAALSFMAWSVINKSRPSLLPLAWLGAGVAALGAGYHHARYHVYAADDVGNFATEHDKFVHLRGVVEQEPRLVLHRDPLRSQSSDTASTIVRCLEWRTDGDWQPLSGRVRLSVVSKPAEPPTALRDIHVGDVIEANGRLRLPPAVGNPGEFDYREHLLDEGVRAIMLVSRPTEQVVRLDRGWPNSPWGLVNMVRTWGQRQIRDALGPPYAELASALLLGDGAMMTQDDWDKYVRTGTVHVLAISGQHLAILGGVLVWLLQRLGMRVRSRAVFVAVVMAAYAAVTGGHAPIFRSAVGACAICGAMVLRRPTQALNVLALGWLAVAAVNPGDLFDTGCQLSFLSVGVLLWLGAWLQSRPEPDPLDQIVAESRPTWLRWLIALAKGVGLAYLVTLALWLVLMPLIAGRQHVICPSGLLLSPPVVVLTSVALLTGFLMLLASACMPPLVPVFAWPTNACLALTDWLVTWAEGWPGGYWYVSDIPTWWLVIFYTAILAWLLFPELGCWWRWAVPGALGWVCVGLIAGAAWLPPDELRCTFLAVGHGTCVVLETPDGRVMLYDTGAIAGPDVTRRQIAPYLWSRGIRRIDEVFLSHADLDHFNGLASLLDRFAVGQVTLTPTFREKATPAVGIITDALTRRKVEVREATVGDVLAAGAVRMGVLHPPPSGPPGNENARSLVLLVEYAGNRILLTGDLEQEGLSQVLALPPQPSHILMAPHHGSPAANTKGLAKWASPKVVISCQGEEPQRKKHVDTYDAIGAVFLSTWEHGAVTVRCHTSGTTVETYRTGKRFTVPRGSPIR